MFIFSKHRHFIKSLKDEIKINQVKHAMTLSFSLVLRTHLLSQLLNYTCLIPYV